MSLNATLNLATLGLFAQKSAMQVVGNNVANVNTPGYSRQTANLSAKSASSGYSFGQIGIGVSVTDITRTLNQHLNDQITSQTTEQSTWQEKTVMLQRVEGILNETPTTGMSHLINNVFKAWQDLNNDPLNMGARASVLSQSSNMANLVQNMDKNLNQVQTDANLAVSATVDKINSLSAQIVTLNNKVQLVEAAGNNANDFRDKRDTVLNELATLIDITSYEQSNGQLFVQTRSGTALVTGSTSFNLQVRANGNNNSYYSVDWNNGQGVTTDITAKIQGGKLQSYIDMRDNVVPGYREKLDTLAGGFIHAINQQHQQGYGLDRSSGNNFFDALTGGITSNRDNTGTASGTITISDSSLVTRDNYTISFTSPTSYTVTNRGTGNSEGTFTYTAGSPLSFFTSVGLNVSLTGTPAAGDSFIAGATVGAAGKMAVNTSIQQNLAKIAASSDGTKADNSNAQSIVNLQLTGQIGGYSAAAGSGAFTFTQYYTTLVSAVGTDTAFSNTNFNNNDNLLINLKNQREGISGVSLDQEMADLIRFQQAYTGASKVIQTINQMMQETANLL